MDDRVERQEEAPVGVIIIREMVGTSARSWSDIVEYHVELKIGFEYEG